MPTQRANPAFFSPVAQIQATATPAVQQTHRWGVRRSLHMKSSHRHASLQFFIQKRLRSTTTLAQDAIPSTSPERNSNQEL